MMPCPLCQLPTQVIDVRAAKPDPALTRRRRRCPSCGHRFSTVEVPLDDIKRPVFVRGRIGHAKASQVVPPEAGG